MGQSTRRRDPVRVWQITRSEDSTLNPVPNSGVGSRWSTIPIARELEHDEPVMHERIGEGEMYPRRGGEQGRSARWNRNNQSRDGGIVRDRGNGYGDAEIEIVLDALGG